MRVTGFCSHGGVEEPRDARYVAINQDERFIVLRRKTRRSALLVAILFIAWYLLYVLASVFARDLMRHRLIGNVNVALVFGVLQFASTFLLARRYTRYSRAALDPLRAQVAADAGPPSRPARADAGGPR
ncbi:MAG: hypothetical protein JWP48_3554 [Actinoallomurus sp.]|jgi:uncharacterized membrane protein (DUF485 family)|nr:hypothetical protein [Actinoallomurus sp.]